MLFRSPDTKLRLRVSIHAGMCLAVSLNSNIDYFGSAVNFAAKIQALAEGGQIAFSESVAAARGVEALLDQERLDVETVTFEAKWSGQSVPVKRVTV